MSRQLPPKPSLEQLKKQAKDLHQAHASGDPEAIALVRQHLPRLSGTSDDQIRQAEVSLQEIQHVLAGEYGFKKWDWLRAVVEVDFDLLVKLSNREIQTLLREVDQKDLVIALKDASDAVRQTLLNQMSERVRSFILQEMVFLRDVTAETVRETRQRILLQVVQLVTQGHIDWPTDAGRPATGRPSSALAPRLLQLARRDLDDLTPDDLAALWWDLAEQARRDGILSLEPAADQCVSSYVKEGLRLAVDGTEPDLIADILKQRSEFALLPRRRTRSSMVLEGLVATMAGDSPHIVHHKLGALYRTEPSEPPGDLREVPVDELAARLREKPFAELSYEQIDALLTDMAHLARRQSVQALRPLIAAAGDPLLRQGLQMICDQATMGQVVKDLEGRIREDLRQEQARHRMVAAGVGAIQWGKTPAEVEQAVRQAGAEAAG